eukprot:jgi/Hompol1/2117/HPOL_002833-RA
MLAARLPPSTAHSHAAQNSLTNDGDVSIRKQQQQVVLDDYVPPPLQSDVQRKLAKNREAQMLPLQKERLTAKERAFYQSMPQRKPPAVDMGIRYYDAEIVAKLKAAHALRRVRISGFQFCSMLDNSVFDAFVHIHPLGGSIASLNPEVSTVIALMDAAALRIKNFIHEIADGISELEAHRYACYAVAEGNNPSANLTDARFIHSFDPSIYFHDTLPSIPEQSSRKLTKRYLMAYLIMVHDESGFNQLKMLIDVLDDGNAIILIHVDLASSALHQTISNYLVTRKAMSSVAQNGDNVFLAQHRFGNTWGHISLIFTQLSGFWELADLADWDYIVNLSNYDWPLRNSRDAHRSLDVFKGFSWIDFWSDSEAVAERFMRPHLGKADHSGVYHPPELGITSWPFAHWKAYKQMQWMILSRQAVNHFRTDKEAISYLAFMEHSLMPEESFFATVLVNSEYLSNLLMADKKRYVRSPSDISSPSWIGWSDRHIFRPTYGQEDPEFLFLRPFNALGDFFGETKLLEWIRNNHLNVDSDQPCYRDQLGYRDRCLREVVSTVTDHDEIVVIPVNRAYLRLTDNLRCSLLHAGMRNILFWAFDIQTHDQLIEAGYLSIYIPSAKGSPHRYEHNSDDFTKIMRNKPVIIRRLLSAGFHVIFLDADTIVTGDFRTCIRSYMRDPHAADIAIAIDETEVVEPTDRVKIIPNANAGIMYVRNTPRSKALFEEVIRRQQFDVKLDDQEALREIFAQPRRVMITGIGLSAFDDAYPGMSLGSSSSSSSAGSSGGILDGGDQSRLKSARMLGVQADSRTEIPPHLRDDGRIRVHFLDQIQFVSGPLFFKARATLPRRTSQFWIIHANGEADPERSLRDQDLWFVDDAGACSVPKSLETRQRGTREQLVDNGSRDPTLSDETKYDDVVRRVKKEDHYGGASQADNGNILESNLHQVLG